MDEVYVSLNTKVVGVRHYSGLVGVGEMVVLKRQPDNPYDSSVLINHPLAALPN
jgi:SWI/SNF-related matrix-associated actin-dependent regulator of chromatin subfamily A3